MRSDVFSDLRKREEICRIRKLFRAVLKTAAKDAYGKNAGSRKNKKLKADALDFFNNEEDLKTICLLAGAQYEMVYGAAKNKKEKNKEKYNKIISSFL